LASLDWPTLARLRVLGGLTQQSRSVAGKIPGLSEASYNCPIPGLSEASYTCSNPGLSEASYNCPSRLQPLTRENIVNREP
jgi:hypothetical protein